MPAYVIVQVEVLDPEIYEQYKELTPSSVMAYGGRFVVRGGDLTHLEGVWDPSRLVIIEFESTERALAWYDSPEYRKARAVREGAARMTMTVVQGC